MKKIFKKLAAYFVTTYANRTYRNAVKVADSWYKAKNKRYYVITDPRDDGKLVAIDKKGFLQLRHDLGISSKDCTLAYLKQTCWYYTLNENGKDRIPAREMVTRRLAFVRDRLVAAKLLEQH